MASTFPAHTWNDDTGTPSAPNNDGTSLENSELQTIIGKINQMFAGGAGYNPFVVGGGFKAEGYDSNGIAGDFNGSRAGVLVNRTRNANGGTGSLSEVRVGNNGAEDAGRIVHTSSAFTPSGFLLQDAFGIIATRVGGLNLAASHASGLVRQMGKSGYSVLRANITADQTDYNPGDYGVYILTPDASRAINGWLGLVDGRRFRIINGAALGSGFVLTLGHLTGSAGGQFQNTSGGGLGINPGGMVDVVGDGTAGVWITK